MKKDTITKLHGAFEGIVNVHPDSGVEFWYARDLQPNLGYAKWENFAKVVEKARTACAASGHTVEDHFLDVRKMVSLGSGVQREIEDIALTRYACYLIAMNGDPGKDPIAFAQAYFAVQTRKQELIETGLRRTSRRLNAGWVRKPGKSRKRSSLWITCRLKARRHDDYCFTLPSRYA
jgi:DNA-damage-inducible protein D